MSESINYRNLVISEITTNITVQKEENKTSLFVKFFEYRDREVKHSSPSSLGSVVFPYTVDSTFRDMFNQMSLWLDSNPIYNHKINVKYINKLYCSVVMRNQNNGKNEETVVNDLDNVTSTLKLIMIDDTLVFFYLKFSLTFHPQIKEGNESSTSKNVVTVTSQEGIL